MKNHNYYIYIITNKTKTVLYTGVTNDLERRLQEHARGLIKGFASKYHVRYLIYHEHFQYINEAINREKQIKGWTREKKESLINSINPNWNFYGVSDSESTLEKV